MGFFFVGNAGCLK